MPPVLVCSWVLPKVRKSAESKHIDSSLLTVPDMAPRLRAVITKTGMNAEYTYENLGFWINSSTIQSKGGLLWEKKKSLFQEVQLGNPGGL